MRLLTKAAFAALLLGTTAIAAPAFADDTGCPPGLHRADSETGQNNNAMNRGVLEASKKYINGKKLEQGMLNRVEAVIRTFDPCLSCSTHAFGQMPLSIELVAPDGSRIDEIHR